uniref:Uncharacterized protein n=1 Tax=Parascaris univalens TaxID=6257 RepID=A0A915B1A5_PARUN
MGKLIIFAILLPYIITWLQYLALADLTAATEEDTSATTTLISNTTGEISTESSQLTVSTSQSATTVDLSTTTTAPQHVHNAFSGGTFFGGIVLGMALMTLLYGVYAIWVRRRSVQSEYNSY